MVVVVERAGRVMVVVMMNASKGEGVLVVVSREQQNEIA